MPSTDPTALAILFALLALGQAFAVGCVLVPVARALGPRLGLVDRPTLDRKIHTQPTPRSGGLALFATFWGCLFLNLFLVWRFAPGIEALPTPIRVMAGNIPQKLGTLLAIFSGCLVIFALGVADDRLDLPARTRLAIQFLATVPLIAGGVTPQVFLPPVPLDIGVATVDLLQVVVIWPVTAIWLVLLTNSFNFLDNMNGLTSGVAVISACVLGLISALAREWYMLAVFMLLAGSALAFWRVNFLRGDIFLGDAGSTHLGFLFAALTIVATYYEVGVPTKLPVLMPVLVLAIPLFDTISVMWIRWRTGKPLMVGDRNHLSHRLADLGFSRREAVVVIYGFTLCVGLAAVALRQLDWRHGLVQTAMVALLFAIIHRIERVSRRRVAASGS